jgi:hypothetical protein
MSEKQTSIDPGMVVKKYFQIYKQAVGKFPLNF